MNGNEEAIAAINAQLEDINTAKQAASEKGKSIGDYDLSTLSSAAAADRVAQEEQKLIKDMQTLNPPTNESPTTTDKSDNTVKYKEYQAKLTKALLDKYPEFKSRYDQIYSTALAEERDNLFAEFKQYGDPHLKQSEMEAVLGKDGLKDFNGIKSTFMRQEAVNFGKGTRGLDETVKDGVLPPESYGLKSALHWQGNVPTKEVADLNKIFYKNRQAEQEKQRQP